MRHERIELDAFYVGERASTAMKNAIAFQGKGDLELAAQVAARESQRHLTLRYAALLLAIDATEMRLAGAVSFTTPSKLRDGQYRESWGPFYLRSFPEGVVVELEVLEEGDGYVVCGKWRAAARFDALVGDAVRTLSHELASHLQAIVSLEA